ncbi:MAG: hypothetical protein U9N49_03215, partial [Campylobacterota bacterium]|nr:hypothetical protein [Campylobacterota bacterium]
MKTYIFISLVVTTALLTSCGGGSSSSSSFPLNGATSIVQEPSEDQKTIENAEILISGKAVDGYLRFSTLCLDLNDDGLCQVESEPTTSTNANGSYALTITQAHQK